MFTHKSGKHILCAVICILFCPGLVLGEEDPAAVTMNAGLNGNWYGGPSRNFEGFNLEVSPQAGGYVLVVNMYAYASEGNPIWLLAVGSVAGSSATDMTVYIYNGGGWGEGFNPDHVVEETWGSATFVANSCDSISMNLVPNDTWVHEGYTSLAYDLIRVTQSAIPCPLD